LQVNHFFGFKSGWPGEFVKISPKM
jgi:hypothetical protein